MITPEAIRRAQPEYIELLSRTQAQIQREFATKAIELAEQGQSIRQISSALGVERTRVQRLLAKIKGAKS